MPRRLGVAQYDADDGVARSRIHDCDFDFRRHGHGQMLHSFDELDVVEATRAGTDSTPSSDTWG